MSAAQSMIYLAESAREIERVERELSERESSFVTAISPSSAASTNTHPTAETSCMSSATAVEGRVFRRLQRFQLLPSEIKVQSDMVATYLLAPKVRCHVFEQRKHWWQHPIHLAKAGLGTFVQGRKLLKAIIEYLLLSCAANNSLHHGQQLAESLVLSGFLSPVHEAPEPANEPLGELYVLDNGYYELVAPGATTIDIAVYATVDSSSTMSLPRSIVLPIQQQQPPKTSEKQLRRSEDTFSVWAVTDGATRAGYVGRRSGQSHVRNIFGVASKVRNCYAVVNKIKHHSLALFENDVARQELVCVKLPSTTVEYYTPPGADSPCSALKICSDGGDRYGSNDTVEILILQSKSDQEQWLLALLDAGAAFLETHPAILSFAVSSASLYSLQDTDASGNTFFMSELRGHVALLTNVANGSCNTSAKQILELEKLSTMYGDAGLKVIAFPSAQFGDAEFDNDEELVEYFQKLYDAHFTVLATRDVNGPNARDVMLFCKTRLPGAVKSVANAFIENNFVKFLIDRDGHLFKRYGPNDLPMSMETDIHSLSKAPSHNTT